MSPKSTHIPECMRAVRWGNHRRSRSGHATPNVGSSPQDTAAGVRHVGVPDQIGHFGVVPQASRSRVRNHAGCRASDSCPPSAFRHATFRRLETRPGCRASHPRLHRACIARSWSLRAAPPGNAGRGASPLRSFHARGSPVLWTSRGHVRPAPPRKTSARKIRAHRCGARRRAQMRHRAQSA